MTIEANSLIFRYNDYYDFANQTNMRMYDTRTGSYTTFSTNNNSYNSAAITITRAYLNSNFDVYFRWGRNDYYSTAISVYELDEATTGSRMTIYLNNDSAPSL